MATGNVVLQFLIGALVSGLVGLKTYWNKVKGLFHKKRPGSGTETTDP